MKLVNIADEGAKYKWQLYDLYDKAFPEQEKKPLQVMENLVADGKMEMLAMVDEDEFVGLAINLIDAEQGASGLLCNCTGEKKLRIWKQGIGGIT